MTPSQKKTMDKLAARDANKSPSKGSKQVKGSVKVSPYKVDPKKGSVGFKIKWTF